MTLTYQEEKMDDAWLDGSVLWDAYYDEVRGSEEAEKLSLNRDMFKFLEQNGKLQVVTVRVSDTRDMVGFHVASIHNHHHHKDTVCGFFEAWYVSPGHRHGSVGFRLLREAEARLKEKGVERIYGGHSLQHDVGVLFKRLGYMPTEIIYCKTVKD